MKIKTLKNGKKFGVEIECYVPDKMDFIRKAIEKGLDARDEIYNHTTRTWWKITTDGSLREYNLGQAIEVVSPPLSGVKGWEELKKITDTLKEVGAKVGVSCGLHIHVYAEVKTNGNGLSKVELMRDFVKGIFEFYGKYEVALDLIMPQSRRGDGATYARRVKDVVEKMNCTGRYEGMPKPRITTIQEIYDNVVRRVAVDRNWLGPRYCKVNIDSFVKYGTIEFRHHSGTVEFEKIASWVMVLEGIMKTVKQSIMGGKELRYGNDFTDMMIDLDGNITKSVRAYMFKRFNHFAVKEGRREATWENVA